MRVYVGADAEAEDAGVGAIGPGDILDDSVFAGDADGGKAVSKENDDERSVSVIGAKREGFLEGIVNGSATCGLKVLDEGLGARALVHRRIGQFTEQRFNFGSETNDLETIGVV